MSVLVFIENKDRRLHKADLELASYASSLAGQLGSEAIALWFGQADRGELDKLGGHGIETIYANSSDAFDIPSCRTFAAAIAQVAREVKAQITVMSCNNLSKAIAPRVAVRLNAGFASCVQGKPVQLAPFVASKRIFNGKILAQTTVNTGQTVVTLAQNSFGIIAKHVSPTIVNFGFEAHPDIRVIRSTKPGNTIQLSEASIVVSGGRGMHSPDNWKPLEELASTLGAALACSRPVSDDGWRPHSEHVGQTGKIISPDLYMAFGISGATQHIGGVSSSKCIVAVNTDVSAPVFEVADYGIVGDANEVIPKLIEAAKQ